LFKINVTSMENIKNLSESIINRPQKLSKSQKTAVKSNKNYIKIIAGAGAGKTETLARRIIYLILVKKVDPKSIVAFTFTDRAAESLRSRIYSLASYFKAYEILNHFGEIYIGTIHSYAKRILEDYFNLGNYIILDQNKEMAFLLNKAYDLEINGYEKNLVRSVIDFQRTSNMVYNELIDIDKLKKNATDFYIKFNSYNKLLENYKLFNFGKIIYDLDNKLRENESKINEINVKYLFVDEFQDINYAQYCLIKLIGKYSNIVVVGDKRQTIYQWRGSNYKFFDDFDKEFPNVETIIIPENRRSLKNIVINANKFVNSFNDSKYNDMKYDNNKDGAGALILGRFDDYNDEANNIAKTILKLKNNGTIKNYSDIGILMRSVKKSADGIIKALKENNIPYIIAGNVGLFKRDEAMSLAMIFSWLSDSETAEFDGITGDDLLKKAYNLWSNIVKINDYEAFKNDIDDIKNKIFESGNDHKNESDKGYKHLTAVFQDVLNALNYKSLDIENDELIMANIGRFNELLTDYETAYWYGGKKSSLKTIITHLYKYIKNYAMDYYDEQEIDDIKDLNAVNIMTVHQAKGLEWPFVFLTSISNKIFPNSMVGKKLCWCGVPDDLFDRKRYEGSIEDEKKLFYVAITRPKYNLIITNYKEKNNRNYRDSDFIENLSLNLFEDFSIDKNRYFNCASEKKEDLKSFGITDLMRYDNCHYSYLLRNIFGYQPGINEAIGYGNALHFVLRMASKLMDEGYDCENAVIEAIDEYFHLPYAGEKTLKNLKHSGLEILKKFVANHAETLKNEDNVEYRLEFPIEKASIIGKVDIVIKDKDNSFEILDYKTDKSVQKEDQSFIQLNTYAMGLAKLGKEPLKAHIAYLTENELKEIDISKESRKLAEDEIIGYIKNIENKNFKANAGNHCKNCDVKKICRYYNGD